MSEHFKDYCIRRHQLDPIQMKKDQSQQLKAKQSISKEVRMNFEQINALMNAAIHNQELREDLIQRETFWSLIDDLVSFLQGIGLYESQDDEGHLFESLQEQLTRLMSIIAISKNESFFASKSKNYQLIKDLIIKLSQTQKISIKQIYSKNFLFNLHQDLSKRTVYYGDSLLPISQSCYKNEGKESEFDIVFIQGSESHPIRTWYMSRENQKVWPKELLDDHFGKRNPRIFLVSYEARFLERAHFLFNLPNNDIDDFAKKIQSDLSQAGIGQKPLIIISYSMGGVITRNMILQDQRLRKNLKGVVFIASPLKGSTMEKEINEDMQNFLSVTHSFMSPTDYSSIPKAEFNRHFYDSGLKIDIPYLCLLESKRTYLKYVGKEYYYVTKMMGTLEPQKEHTYKVLEGKKHSDIQRAENKNDILFKSIIDFIELNLSHKLDK